MIGQEPPQANTRPKRAAPTARVLIFSVWLVGFTLDADVTRQGHANARDTRQRGFFEGKYLWNVYSDLNGLIIQLSYLRFIAQNSKSENRSPLSASVGTNEEYRFDRQ